MTRFEELLEGSLAQELSAEETREFVALLALDEHRKVFDRHHRMTVLLAGVTRHSPSPSFTEEVLARLPERSSRPLRKLWTLLWAPRVARWNLASAFGLGLLLVVTPVLWRTLANWTTAIPEPHPVVTLFRCSVDAPTAQQVSIAGDFNGWRTDETFLSDATGRGRFSVTLPLRPGRYAYMFVVDGTRWVTDPRAEAYRDDGFGHRNAVVNIEAPRAPNGST